MKNQIRNITGVLLFCSIFIMAQGKNYNLTFNKSEIINRIIQTDKYLSVRVYNDVTDLYSAYLFDNGGNKLFTVNDKLTSMIMLSEPLDDLNLFVVVNTGEEGYQSYKGTEDIIRAFDISTGEEKWRANSNANYYEISPDGKYILTKSRSSNGRKSRFEIINLKDGSKIVPDLKLATYNATWYDNENILIVDYLIGLDQEYLIARKILADKLSKIHFKRQVLDLKIKAGEVEIDEDEYKKRMNTFLEKRDSVQMERRELEKTREFTTKRANLLKYNLNSNEIVNQKELRDNNGDFFKPALDDSYGIVSVNKKGEIFLVGRDDKKKKEVENYVVKLDKNLKILWNSELLPLKGFQKINIDGEIIFRYSIENKPLYLDNDNGKTISIRELQDKTNLPADINEITIYKNKTVNIYSNLSIKSNNGSISIIKEVK